MEEIIISLSFFSRKIFKKFHSTSLLFSSLNNQMKYEPSLSSLSEIDLFLVAGILYLRQHTCFRIFQESCTCTCLLSTILKVLLKYPFPASAPTPTIPLIATMAPFFMITCLHDFMHPAFLRA